MASTFGSLTTMMTSLRAQSLAQQIIANNIANATSRGYTRQIPILTALAPLTLPSLNSAFGPGQIGMGVRLASIERIRDEFLDSRIRSDSAVLGEQEAMQKALSAMAVLFPEIGSTPGAGLVTAVQTFFSDWTGLASGTVSRGALLNDAVNMTSLFHQADATLRELEGDLDQQVRSTMEKVNSLLTQIASANQGIMAAQAAGGSANSLMDSRDLALADLSKLVKIDTVNLADGSVLVMTGNARTLVRGAQAGSLSALSEEHEPSFAAVGLKEAGTRAVIDVSGEIGGGAIKGLMTARDEVVWDERLEIDELASSLIAQVNTLHLAGWSQDGMQTGIPFFVVTNAPVPFDASNIEVNQALLANPVLLGASAVARNGTDTGQAVLLGALGGYVMNSFVQSFGAINTGFGPVDPTLAMNDPAHSAQGLNGGLIFAANGSLLAPVFKTPPAASGTVVINGVSIPWANTDSINQMVDRINTMMGGEVRASFEWNTVRERLTLVGDGPITVYDSAGNFTQVFRLESKQVSLTAVNNGIGPLDRPIPTLTPLDQAIVDWRTVAGNKGQVTFEWQAPAGTPVSLSYSWDSSQDLTGPAGIVTGINAALAGAGAPFRVQFSATTQMFTIQGQNGWPAGSALPISPVSVTDSSGNLSMLFNLEAQPRFGDFGETLLAQMQVQQANTDAMVDQARAGLDQLQLQQDAITKVNIDEEQAQLLAYTRAYEAAVRALAALDECLNVLINRMAASTFSGSSTSSVLTS